MAEAVSTKEQLGEVEKQGKELRIDADRQFKAGNYRFAIETYTKATQLDISPKLALSVYTNMAIAHSKLGNYGDCKECASKCIEIDTTYVRGYFWKAMSEIYLNSLEEATRTFDQGLKVDSKNKDLRFRLRFLEFCKKHQEIIIKYPQKNWLEIEDAVNGNLKFCSEEVFAKEVTKMTKRRKDGGIVCISSGVCNYFGKIISMEIPNNAFSDKQKEINMKLKMGEYMKIYIQVTISKNTDGSRAYLFKIQSLPDAKFNDIQTYALEGLETAATTTGGAPYNPHYSKLLFESEEVEDTGATPN
ncbi:hypothetical protein LOD99_3288 [Oopsacas minuta]|uniref:Uncharacterized protein n=1 Tax=Oopsacas minuta TaxID=111878 RepID=A0AAV7JZ75_9METZ|nr:hypothetical protein LOD99_3288 [Oopsacas minuta]